MKKLLFPSLFCLLYSFAAHAQLITTIAGNTAVDYGEGNEAWFSILHGPWGIATDDKGNVYFSQANSNIISFIDSSGLIYRFAGAGSAGYSGDAHKSRNSELNHPCGLAFDRKGNMFIADSKNNVIRKVNKSNNMISTAYTGFNNPIDLVFDKHGALFVSDGGNGSIRKIDTNGVINTVIGGFTSGGSWTGGYGGTPVAEEVRFGGVAVDDSGNIYMTDRIDNIIRKLTPHGDRLIIAGTGERGYNGDGPATSVKLAEPTRIVIAPNGDLVFTDLGNCRVRRLSADGMLTTIAGKECGYGGDGGDAPKAMLSNPAGLAYDKNGILYVVDNGNGRIRKIYPWAAGVNDVAKNTALTIYPNPNNGSFTIKGNLNAMSVATVTVTDLAGNIVYRTGTSATATEIDMQVTLHDKNIANGTYLIAIQAGTETILSHMVIER